MIPQDAAVAITDIPKVDLSHPAAQGTFAIARLIMKITHWLLSLVGLQDNSTVFTAVYAVFVFLISIAVGYVIKWIIVFIIRKIGNRFHNVIYQYLTNDHFFTKTARIVPAIVFLIFIQFTLNGRMTLSSWLTRLTWIYLSYVLADTFCVLADVLWTRIDSRENKKKLPLKGIVQLIKGIVWIIFVIVTFAIIFDKSPGSLFAGLGAFSAVLMLVFKDNILGVVAGVQLSENDSLHVGDWIKVSGTDANGIVTEVSLVAVKVLNWDKTTTTIPPYNLVSVGFTNYNTMQNSNTRRIQRSYMIDADSVVPCDDAMLDEFAKIPLMKDWITRKRAQRLAGKEQNAANPEGLADGSIDTNLGVFRAYVKMWLDANPNVAHSDPSDTCFVTTLPQTPSGIPFQIYCFTSTSAWVQYEAIMCSIFEHIAVMLYRFRLYTYESPSGRDTIIDGYICPGKNTDNVFGIPYPFYEGSTNPSNPGIAPSSVVNKPAGNHGDPSVADVDGVHSASPAHPASPASPAS